MNRPNTRKPQFTSAQESARIYDGKVHLLMRYPALIFTAILCLSAALAALALWVFSHARTPFDYMVVGTLAATAGLIVAFFYVVKRRLM
jgi:hypothetical protein